MKPKVFFGTAGTSGLGYEDGILANHEYGLNAMEVEFTYSVHMNALDAKEIGKLAKEKGIKLSIHAPFFVNLAAKEEVKVAASRKRILDSCRIGYYLGVEFIVFHAGFYLKRDKEEVFQIIKKEIIDLQKEIDDKGYNVKLAPETTGKFTQFGDLDELIRLSNETGCHLTIDFAHLRARQDGEIDYEKVINKVLSEGKNIDFIHSHFSGIEWTDKGEKKHLVTEEFEIKRLVEAIKKTGVNITVINESPYTFNDAVRTLKEFED